MAATAGGGATSGGDATAADGTTAGAAGAAGGRCFGDGDPLYERYHDEEWGRPVTDEHGVFERLSLEAFQSGLSWRTILAKRPAFRAAFADFDVERVAAFDPADEARLLADAGIVRNRLKVAATISNARAVLALHAAGEDLASLVWAHAEAPGARPAPATFADVPALTPASTALAKELKRRGLRFVGPTTAYALMQALGLVNDHVATCPWREATEDARRAARPPRITPRR